MSNEQKGRVDRTQRVAQRVIGSDLSPVPALYEKCLLAKVKVIMTENTHLLNDCFRFNRSGIRLCPPRNPPFKFS